MALNDVSFVVGRGEFAFLTGPSGSGKSTILKLVYMDELPTRGAVWVGNTKAPAFGARHSAAPPKARRRLPGFPPARRPHVEQNVAFALEVVGTSRDKIGSKVSRLLTRVGLASKATNYPREFGGGEQQRVAIARALVNDTFVLIADEPTGNLDDRATRGVFQLLKDINNSGTAVLMATHNMELVKRNESRVLKVNRGQLVFDSSEGNSLRILTPDGAAEKTL